MRASLYTLIITVAGILVSAHAFAEDTASTTDHTSLSGQFQQLIGNNNPDHEDWSLHGQATEVYQGYPSFNAPYSGANSLSPNAQQKATTSATFYLGRRLWSGAEVYYDPELYQGKGLSDSYGIAGFPNGEANKSGTYQPKIGPARIFLRQVIGFGGETEKIAADKNQLAAVEDISRVTITAGKFAVTDIFDNNSYSHDPRTQFLNWSLMDSGAVDIPANSRGYTQGFAIDFNQENWALRYGFFLEPDQLNQSNLVLHGANNAGQMVELEERYKIANNPGTVRFLGFLNRNRGAKFSKALGAADVNTALTQAEGYGGTKYGFGISAEQQLTDGIGVFARVSWNDGKTEEWSFTQIDKSAAVGLSVVGSRWDRPDDVWGIAGVANGLSSDQRHFLEQGGGGLIIGDGALNYSPEMIVETYYALKLNPYATLSPDYQFVANPGYNRDRGPVNIFAARLHVEF